MNPVPHCNCCPPAICAACMPQCSTKAFLRRAERPLKYEAACSPKNCSIFGGHDTNSMPELQCKEKDSNIGENKNSLGSPIGVTASNVNFRTEGKHNDIVQARYATYLEAFARLHLNDEKSWDSLLIDDIMKEGLSLYTTSRKQGTTVDSPTNIYMPSEEKVLREFELSGFTFHIELMPQFKLKALPSTETGAQGDGVELTLEDFVPVMKNFFRKRKYGLILVGQFYVMIWRSKDAYFVFDTCGRRVTDFQSDRDKGVAMLMCFKSLENVRHLIVNLSGLQVSDPLIIRELKVVKVITPNGSIIQKEYRTRTHQFVVVNDDYAYLKSDLHLTLNRRDLLRNRSGLPVAVTAIVVSKIDHPATWDMKMVDKIICFGVTFCQKHWQKCKSNDAIDVNKFPTYFNLGQFYIIIELLSQKYIGTWRCVPGFKDSELALALKKAFDEGDHKLVLQINYQMYAIWKKHDFIYILDPYRHRILGKKEESEIYEDMEKSATLRMFRSFEVFMNVLNHILLDSNRASPFLIHIVKVKNIQTQPKGKSRSVKPIVEPKVDDNGEVLSINEHICFEEAEYLCKAALGEISDYEDEDLRSDIFEMELRTSSSEAELLEEEEGNAGDLEEMEGLESSSSGEEGRSHKKRSQTRRGHGKGGKGKGKGKGNKQGVKGKSKKGKGVADSEDVGKRKRRQQNDNASDDTDAGYIENYNSSKGTKGGKYDTNRKDQDKDVSRDKDSRKDKDYDQAKDKNLRRDRDKDKEISNEKDQSNIRGPNKNKDVDKYASDDKDRDFSKNKDLGKDKNVTRNNELNIDKNQSKVTNQSEERSRDKNLKNNDLETNGELLTEKDLSKDKDWRGDKQTRGDKDLSQTNGLKKDKDTWNDNDVSKDNKLSTKKDTGRNEGMYDDDDAQSKYKIFMDKHEKRRKEYSNASDDNLQPELADYIAEQGLDHERLMEEIDDMADIEYSPEEGKGSDKENEIRKPFNTITGKRVAPDKIKELEKEKSHQHKSPRSFYQDGTEADDENEEFFKKNQPCYLPNPHCYPGYLKCPVNMVVVGSETGSYESLCKLFHAGFKAADRVLIMTPWGNFVIFRCSSQTSSEEKHYYLYDGCTCNYDRFRHLDLSVGTAGLLHFKHIHDVIAYIRLLRKSRRNNPQKDEVTADDICREYCNRNSTLRL